VKISTIDRVVSRAVIRSIRRSGVPNRKNKKAVRLTQQISTYSQKLDAIPGLIVDGTISESDARDRIIDLKRKRADLELELSQIPEDIPKKEIAKILAADVDIEQAEQMRPILELVVDEIRLQKSSLEIKLRPPFDRTLKVQFFTELSS